jgi:hypothetical protein
VAEPLLITDVPRNQTTVNLNALDWRQTITTYKASAERPSDGLWMPIRGESTEVATGTKIGFVYSAFLDARVEQPGHVTVLGMVYRRVTKLYCQLHYASAGQYASRQKYRQSFELWTSWKL